MSVEKPDDPTRPGIAKTRLCLLWVLVVCTAYLATYGVSLLSYARVSAERFPVLSRILELLHLGP